MAACPLRLNTGYEGGDGRRGRAMEGKKPAEGKGDGVENDWVRLHVN